MEGKDFLVASLSILLVFSSLGTYFYYDFSQEKIESLEKNNTELNFQLNQKRELVEQLNTTLNETESELKIAQSEIKNLSTTVVNLNQTISELKEEKSELEDKFRLSKPNEKDYYLLAVSEGQGETLELESEVELGDGDISVTVNKVVFENNTQFSVNDAWKVAEGHTGLNLSNYDGRIQVEHDYEGYLSVTGDSGGAAFTVSLIAALQNKTIDKDILITGTIELDGDIGPVGDVKEKVVAAREFGADVVLVPQGSEVKVSGIETEEIRDIGEATNIILKDF